MTTISELQDRVHGLSPRAYLILHSAGIRTKEHLQGMTRQELLAVYGMGKVLLAEVEQWLAYHGGGLADPTAQAQRIAELKERVIEAAIARWSAEGDYDRFFLGSTGEHITATEAVEIGGISERVQSSKKQFDEAVSALVKEPKPTAAREVQT